MFVASYWLLFVLAPMAVAVAVAVLGLTVWLVPLLFALLLIGEHGIRLCAKLWKRPRLAEKGCGRADSRSADRTGMDNG